MGIGAGGRLRGNQWGGTVDGRPRSRPALDQANRIQAQAGSGQMLSQRALLLNEQVNLFDPDTAIDPLQIS